MYITRIAPSPTGLMHVGTARTAVFNWLVARASGGKFLIRIDDTDTERNQPEAVQPIFDGLEWLGLDNDGVFYQSQRIALYQHYAQLLLDDGLAHVAENGAILLNLPDDLPGSWTDGVKGEIPVTERDHTLITGLPLLRGGDKLGQPTYQFASVVDDYLMGINFIVRGVDHISNTTKQVAIWYALNRLYRDIPSKDGLAPRALPKFTHVGLITQNGKKMSKRDGAASLLDYREKGYHPDALFSYLVRLGWGPKVDDKTTATMTRDQALAMFLEGGNMRSSPAGFDAVRLDATNKKFWGWAARAQRLAAS